MASRTATDGMDETDEAARTTVAVAYYECIEAARQAALLDDFMLSTKMLRKAVDIAPKMPVAHFELGNQHLKLDDPSNALPHLLNAIERSDTGTLYQSRCGEELWALATTRAFFCLNNKSCWSTPKPEWYNNPAKRKLMADRVAATGVPDTPDVLHMHALAYEFQENPSTDDLRQALRDWRSIMEKAPALYSNDGPRRIQELEEKLRARITEALSEAVRRACRMCGTSCAEARMCGLCKERRTPDPAYYCSKACAKQHWTKEHRVWHEERKAAMERLIDTRPVDFEREDTAAAATAASENAYESLIGRADQAALRDNFRDAAKFLRKAILLDPSNPNAHKDLGYIFATVSNDTEAVQHLLKAMELSDAGTEWHAQMGDRVWAKATSGAFCCFYQPACTADTPAWFTDESQRRIFADRVAVVLPNDLNSLQMRATTYELQPNPSADDLRQAVRDRQHILDRLLEIHAEGSVHTDDALQRLKRTEEMLAGRIEFDENRERALADHDALLRRFLQECRMRDRKKVFQAARKRRAQERRVVLGRTALPRNVQAMYLY